MSLFAKGDAVKLNPAVLEDLTQKRNRHLLVRVIKENDEGIIREQDIERSGPEAFYYWVRFSYFAILLSEFHLMKVVAS